MTVAHERLIDINEDEWLHGVKDFGQRFGCAMGSQVARSQYGSRLDRSWLKGQKENQRFYRAA